MKTPTKNLTRRLATLKSGRDFEAEYRKMLSRAVAQRRGRARERIANGLGFAERLFAKNVLMPVLGNLDAVTPEYEVRDYGDGTRFIDFLCSFGEIQLAVEIDGYGPHARDVSAGDFCDNLMRQDMLTIDGFHILRFPVDYVKNRPRLCQQVLQQFMGAMLGRSADGRVERLSLTAEEREIVRLARGMSGLVRPVDIHRFLQVSRTTAYAYIGTLVGKGLLSAVTYPSGKRIAGYRVTELGRTLGI